MKYSILNCFSALVLAASCNILMASALERGSRVRRVSTARKNNGDDRRLQRRSIGPRRTRTRGSQEKRQSRRQLGGKDGGKSGSKSGSSSGSGGSSGSGNSTDLSTAGYTDDGLYVGCLSNTYQEIGFNFDTHDLGCDYTVEQNSYGFGHTDPEPDNTQSVQPEYFSFGRFQKWTVIQEETESDYFQTYNENQQEGRNADDGYQGDDDEEEEAGTVVVQALSDDYNPYAAFDIGKCDTYSHLWTYDLLISCEGATENCVCMYTEELINMGLLTCSDLSKCPDECGVCATCLHSICDQYLPSALVASGLQSSYGWTLAAVITTVALAGWVAHKRKRDSEGILNETFLDADGIPYAKRDWKVRLGKDGLPTEKKSWRAKKTAVWLVPDVSALPTRKPLFPDVLEGGKKNKNAEVQAPKKQKKKRSMGPVIVTSSDASIPSSLSSCGVADYNEFTDNSHVGNI